MNDRFYKKIALFRTKIRQELVPILKEKGFSVQYDNEEVLDEIGDGYRRYIFRLEFLGKKKVEIYNNDWRDYTEYFNIDINGEQSLLLNIDKYDNLDFALREMKKNIIDSL